MNAPQSATELVFTPSESVLDGRFANNGWLQETPDFPHETDLGQCRDSQSQDRRTTRCAAWLRCESYRSVRPLLNCQRFYCQAKQKVRLALPLGTGERQQEKLVVTTAAGVDPVVSMSILLRTLDGLHFTSDFEITTTGKTYEFATTQDHHAIDTVGLEETGRRVGESRSRRHARRVSRASRLRSA